jgi:plasmid stabilization system protein ParE
VSRTYTIRYLATAQADLLEIFDYIARDNPETAASLLEEFDQAIGNLASHPFLL